MARSRNIKPGFSRNEDLAECSVWARLCFALLPTVADREGRLEDRPKRIKGELFPFDTVDVDPLLAELQDRGLITRYTVDGRALIQILAFLKHQNPHHREPPSILPEHPSLRLDADGKWVKPEALAPLQEPQAPDKPEASPGLDPPRVDLQGGSNRVDSGNSDSGTMIPERRDSEADASGAAAPPAPPPSPPEAKPLTAKDRVWLLGPPLLGEGNAARSLLGKLAKAYGDEVLAEVLAAATLDPPHEPKAWVTAACAARAKAAPPKANGHHQAQADLLDDAKPEWAINAGFRDRFIAENAGCTQFTAKNFRDGKRVS
jgi:hypothetical protein